MVAVIDEQAKMMTGANAGHPWPLGCTEDSCRSLPEHGMLLGVIQGAEYKDEVIQLDLGTRVVFVTDGVTGARKDSGDSELFCAQRTRFLSEAEQ